MTKNNTFRYWNHFLIAIIGLLIVVDVQSQNIPLNEPNYNLPHHFDNFKDTVVVEINCFNSLFQKKPGDEISINTNSSFAFRGVLKSIESKYEGQIETAILQLYHYDNTILVFSKVQLKNSEPSYRAVLLSKGSGDFMELKQTNSQFILLKGKMEMFRVE